MKLFKRALISFAALIMLIGTAADAVSKPAAPAQRPLLPYQIQQIAPKLLRALKKEFLRRERNIGILPGLSARRSISQ